MSLSKNMKPIIEPVSRNLILSELNSDRFIRKTNKGDNEIYIVNSKNSPHTMREIGRLREVTFRAAGGGTGEEIDVDIFDTSDVCYEQLIVYSPEDKEIIGGYRFIDSLKAIDTVNKKVHLSTANYYEFSEQFIRRFLPQTIELGRSWVQPNYQPSVNPRKGLFALDNIWDGLGAIAVENPHIKYFFGKVTMYTHYNREARDLILYFLKHYFPDYENLLHPFHPLKIETPIDQMDHLFKDVEYKDGFKILNQSVRNLGEFIPPLVNIYMNLSRTMKTFGTATNPHFGDVEETAIMITIDDIYPEKKERHMNTYVKNI
jgi:hypothetical protein